MGKKPVAPGGENGENTIYKVSHLLQQHLLESSGADLCRRRIGELDSLWTDIENITNRDSPFFFSFSGV